MKFDDSTFDKVLEDAPRDILRVSIVHPTGDFHHMVTIMSLRQPNFHLLVSYACGDAWTFPVPTREDLDLKHQHTIFEIIAASDRRMVAREVSVQGVVEFLPKLRGLDFKLE